jgi:hypothetical protein
VERRCVDVPRGTFSRHDSDPVEFALSTSH